MKLTGKQKKFIKHNKKTLSPDQIASRLQITEKEVQDHLKKQLSEDDFKKFQLGLQKKETNGISLFSWRRFLSKNWPMLIIFVLLIGIAYANSLNNAFVSDDKGIYETKNLGTLKYVFSTPFHFIGNLFYSLAYKIGGYTPIYYRLSNIFFHLGAVVGVYVLFSVLVDDLFGFIVASLFAVHPILIESIGWIAGFQYVQYGFFCLWSLITYILFQQNKKIYYFLLSIFFYALSLLASEKAIVFPFIFIIYEISYGNLKKNWKYVLVFFLITLLPTMFYISQISARIEGLVKMTYEKHVVSNPLIQIPIAVTTYIQLIFWPNTLTLYHSELLISLIEYIIRWVILLSFIILTIYGFIKKKPIFFWFCFFIIILSPTLTPLGIAWAVAERYVYLGSLGIFYIIGYLLMKLIKNKKTEALGYMLFIVIIISLLARTIVRNFEWKNEDSLWIATGKTSPSDPKTHNNLGDVYSRRGDLQKSAEEFAFAIRLNPNYADAYHNLGNIYFRMGKSTEAIAVFNRAVKINPELWQSYQNLAAIYYNQKQYNLAEESLKKAILINQQDAVLRVNLGVVYMRIGNKSMAKQLFLETLRLDPENNIAKTGLSKIN